MDEAAQRVVGNGFLPDLEERDVAADLRFRRRHSLARGFGVPDGVSYRPGRSVGESRWSRRPFSITNVAASSRECAQSFVRMFWMCVRAVSVLMTSCSGDPAGLHAAGDEAQHLAFSG